MTNYESKSGFWSGLQPRQLTNQLCSIYKTKRPRKIITFLQLSSSSTASHTPALRARARRKKKENILAEICTTLQEILFSRGLQPHKQEFQNFHSAASRRAGRRENLLIFTAKGRKFFQSFTKFSQKYRCLA